MSKHTPGPWAVDLDVLPFTVKSGEHHVAQILPQAIETEANARLIAAAPEMLVLLRALSDDDDIYAARWDRPEELRNARALIARIENDD